MGMFGDSTPPPGNECRVFTILIIYEGGDAQSTVDGFIINVEVAIQDGTFTEELTICTVLVSDEVTSRCVVVTPAPTPAGSISPAPVEPSSPVIPPSGSPSPI